MMNRWIVAGALAFVSSVAFAAPVTLTASGQVLETDTDDGIFSIPFFGAVGVGTPVSVELTYDLALFGVDANPDPGLGVYSGGGISARVLVGGQVFQPMTIALGVAPGFVGPALTTYSFGLIGPRGGPQAWTFSLNFELPGANPTDSLPVGPLDPAQLLNLRLQYQIQQGFNADQSLNQYDRFAAPLETTPVPLPAAGWLLFAGLGGLAGLRRARKQ